MNRGFDSVNFLLRCAWLSLTLSGACQGPAVSACGVCGGFVSLAGSLFRPIQRTLSVTMSEGLACILSRRL